MIIFSDSFQLLSIKFRSVFIYYACKFTIRGVLMHQWYAHSITTQTFKEIQSIHWLVVKIKILLFFHLNSLKSIWKFQAFVFGIKRRCQPKELSLSVYFKCSLFVIIRMIRASKTPRWAQIMCCGAWASSLKKSRSMFD